MALPIEDYALIGDSHSAALVGRDGSIDWLCLPRFDSAACFAALLGTPENGRWRLAPKGAKLAARRHYEDRALVLVSEWETADGTVRVTDFMPPRTDHPNLIRIVEGVRGSVPMTMELILRYDYGRVVPWLHRVGGDVCAVAGPDAICLRSDVPTHGSDLRTVAEFSVGEGDFVPFVLSWHASHEPPHEPPHAGGALATTLDWWRDWASRMHYRGAWAEDVRQSLMVLKALTYEPTGGIVAAPTTSLPEHIGGVRNWDYRYCWVRDAAFTIWALNIGGYAGEARRFRDWLLRAAAGDPPALQVAYGAAGESRMPESELAWLPGYEGSKPVRVGNAAAEQFQLDVYGETVDTLHLARVMNLELNPTSWSMERLLVEYVAERWRDPDEGIWEVRGGRRQFTHSKVLAWTALDRAVKAVERFGLEGPVDQWRALRDQIKNDVLAHGFDAERNTFTRYYGSRELDASLLLIPLVHFLPATDPRMRGTIAAIERELLVDGLVRRYSMSETGDGLPPGEGVFLPCSFWLVDNYALLGRLDEARQLFERLLSLRTDVGLLAEEYDPAAKRLLGNFPQALTHVGLVTSAYNLDRARRSRAQALRSA